MIITALTLAFLLRTFVVQVFYIPSGSMIPTLEVNDRIAVEKISYLTREPARGEVIVFAGDDPLSGLGEESTADRVLTGVGQFLGVVPVDAKDFVKRVIGLPGDEVSITDGQVSVNGVELDEPYARLDNDSGDWVVPEGMLFVMGDNRANSGDSRSTLGYIPEDDVVGRAVLVIWPFDRAGSIPGEAHDLAVDAGS
ncbi:signal peptidase I [Nitriliruptoria bacterium AS10]|nr:signal peptidase I [Salsipaludibacter albus]MBY5164068.1 signal peptidase I [Salsipaludibacter albus]